MSINNVVSNLVRAAAGIPSDISDTDLDKHVAALLASEAKAKEKSWSDLGLSTYLGSSRDSPDPSLPKPNKRFLASVIRNVDGHNASLIRAQEKAARDVRDERGFGESSRFGSGGSAAGRLFGGALKGMGAREGKRREEEWVYSRDEGRDTGRRHRRRDEDGHGSRDDIGHDGENRSERRRREREEKSRRSDNEEEFINMSPPTRAYYEGRDHEERQEYKSRSRRRRDYSEEEYSRRGSKREHLHSDQEPEVEAQGRYARSSEGSRRERRGAHVQPSEQSRTKTEGGYAQPGEEPRGRHVHPTNSDEDRSRQRKRRHDDDEDHHTKRPEKQHAGRHSTNRSTNPLTDDPPPPKPPREAPPPPPPAPFDSPSPPPARLSKMDKYFANTYDPRMDLGEVPKEGMIAAVGWDNMLAILKDRGKKRRNLSPTLSDDHMAVPSGITLRSPSPDLSSSAKRLEKAEKKKRKEERRKRRGMNSDEEGDVRRKERKEKETGKMVSAQGAGKDMFGVAYSKKGAVREWDVGK